MRPACRRPESRLLALRIIPLSFPRDPSIRSCHTGVSRDDAARPDLPASRRTHAASRARSIALRAHRSRSRKRPADSERETTTRGNLPDLPLASRVEATPDERCRTNDAGLPRNVAFREKRGSRTRRMPRRGRKDARGRTAVVARRRKRTGRTKGGRQRKGDERMERDGAPPTRRLADSLNFSHAETRLTCFTSGSSVCSMLRVLISRVAGSTGSGVAMIRAQLRAP